MQRLGNKCAKRKDEQIYVCGTFGYMNPASSSLFLSLPHSPHSFNSENVEAIFSCSLLSFPPQRHRQRHVLRPILWNYPASSICLQNHVGLKIWMSSLLKTSISMDHVKSAAQQSRWTSFACVTTDTNVEDYACAWFLVYINSAPTPSLLSPHKILPILSIPRTTVTKAHVFLLLSTKTNSTNICFVLCLRNYSAIIKRLKNHIRQICRSSPLFLKPRGTWRMGGVLRAEVMDTTMYVLRAVRIYIYLSSPSLLP